jgi:hypothetical protein
MVGQDSAGLDVHRAARICAAGHGGQVLLSQATQELLGGELPSGVDLRDLGDHRLKDPTAPVQLFQLLIPGLSADFPPLRTLAAHLWVPVIRVTSGDLRILMDQPTEPISSHDPPRRRQGNWHAGLERRCLLQGAVRAVAVVMVDLLAQSDRNCRQPTISIRSKTSRRTVPTQRSA